MKVWPIGTQFVRRGKKRKDVETVIDILTTTNSKGELHQIRYVAVHAFAGQRVVDVDVVGTTIAIGVVK